MPKHSIPCDSGCVAPPRQIMTEACGTHPELLENKAVIIEDIEHLRKKSIAEDVEFNDKLQKEIEYFQEVRKKERDRRESAKLEIMTSVVHTLHDGLINEVEEEDLKMSKWIVDKLKEVPKVENKADVKEPSIKKKVKAKVSITHTPKQLAPPKVKKIKSGTLPRVALLSKPKTTVQTVVPKRHVSRV